MFNNRYIKIMITHSNFKILKNQNFPKFISLIFYDRKISFQIMWEIFASWVNGFHIFLKYSKVIENNSYSNIQALPQICFCNVVENESL